MADQQEAKRKLVLLANRVQGRQLFSTEESRLILALASKRITNRADVTEVLSEGLVKSARDVNVVLESHDDSDRLVDEIVQALQK